MLENMVSDMNMAGPLQVGELTVKGPELKTWSASPKAYHLTFLFLRTTASQFAKTYRCH